MKKSIQNILPAYGFISISSKYPWNDITVSFDFLQK